MAGVALELTLGEFASRCDQKATDLAGLTYREPLRDCGIAIVADVRRNFDEGHGPDNQAWLPLKNPSQRRGGSSSKPLRDKSILSAAATGGANSSTTISDFAFTMSVNLDYARVHQDGAVISHPARSRRKPWVFPRAGGGFVFTRRVRAHTTTIPARPFVGFSDRLVRTCSRILGDWRARRAVL